MPSFRLKLGSRSSTVEVGGGALDRLGEAALSAGLRPVRAAVITDSNVAGLYLDRARKSLERSGFKVEAIEIPAGERSKSIAQLEKLYDRLADAGLTRQSPIFALG